MTTTKLRMDLMLPAMGMKRFTSHNRMPTTIRTATRLIRGMIDLLLSSHAHPDLPKVDTFSVLIREAMRQVWSGVEPGISGWFRLKLGVVCKASVFLLPPQETY
jgi:hypothetical protein